MPSVIAPYYTDHMKKVIFALFAHPDDEAFGPAGTLLVEKAAGNEVHVICATAGENGTNPDDVPDLGAVRLAEWRAAGALLGTDSMHYLGYIDGQLSNSVYLEIADKIQHIVSSIIADRPETEIEFISMDHNGITGHIDHIVIGRVASYLFYRLKATDSRVTRLRLACVPRDQLPTQNCDWLYMDAGRTEQEIGERIDARAHLDTIYDIIAAHHSQRADAATHLKNDDHVAINHFIVKN